MLPWYRRPLKENSWWCLKISMKREGEGTPDGGRPANLFYQGGRVRTRSLLIEDSKKNSGYHLFTASLPDHGFVDVFHGLALFPAQRTWG